MNNSNKNNSLEQRNTLLSWFVYEELIGPYNAIEPVGISKLYFTISTKTKNKKNNKSSIPLGWKVFDQLGESYDELIDQQFYTPSSQTASQNKKRKLKKKPNLKKQSDDKKQTVAWDVFDGIEVSHDALIEQELRLLTPLLKKWDNFLEQFGGDPTHTNWQQFRPLRLTREEDWSDWLAFFLETSTTGVFAHILFKDKADTPLKFAKPNQVLREDFHINYRADLILNWDNENYTHLEIKVGDRNLEKTFATSDEFRSKYRVEQDKWENFILLLSSQNDDWDNVSRKTKSLTIVTPITWDDVAIALRKSFFYSENIAWKSWAYAFIGAIEQLIIGFDIQQLAQKRRDNLATKLNILERGFKDE
ncbi:hypothetical protein [Thalassotalea crassostreae]|uniref:hypothetical protein n=1 Tax=Thalassotalea crassostreae TaxID=1763536 RepID=UPI0012FDBFBB|nr:hypothetical protein [Thalassotalea crassostreae]